MTPEVPAQVRCFIDANILVYHFIQHPVYSAPCEQLMRRIESRELDGCVSPMVVSEALHRIMLSEVQARFNTPKPLAYVQRRPQIIASLSLYASAAAAISRLSLQFLSMDADIFVKATVIAGTEKLLTDDASIVALMRREGIQYLASNDDEFNTIGGIIVCKPR